MPTIIFDQKFSFEFQSEETLSHPHPDDGGFIEIQIVDDQSLSCVDVEKSIDAQQDHRRGDFTLDDWEKKEGVGQLHPSNLMQVEDEMLQQLASCAAQQKEASNDVAQQLLHPPPCEEVGVRRDEVLNLQRFGTSFPDELRIDCQEALKSILEKYAQ